MLDVTANFPMEPAITILHLSDLHLFANCRETLVNINPLHTLEQVVEHIGNAQTNQPDLIVLTGDISQDHSHYSYQLSYEVLKELGCPIIATMGNHDQEAYFTKVFGDPTKIINNLNGDWSLLLLNSQYPGYVSGKLADHDLELLRKHLDRSTKTMIFMHHHAFPSCSRWLDDIDLKTCDQFLAIIKSYENIGAVVCGHIHQELEATLHNIKFLSTPATSWQFAVNSKDFKLDILMPGYRWLKLYSNGDLRTWVTRIDYNDLFIPDRNSIGY